MANGTIGHIVRIMGAVIDVAFPADELPEIYNALEVSLPSAASVEIEGDASQNGRKLVLEVQQHMGEEWVRCVAMDATGGVKRGLPVIDTGGPITVPVGPSTLGRIFNVLGTPVDKAGIRSRRKNTTPSTVFRPRLTNRLPRLRFLRLVLRWLT